MAKEQKMWQGHPVESDEHSRDLDLKAAVLQFHHGMDRHAAEERVKREDKIERHRKAAAHHVDGMKAAHAIGNSKDAQRHHDMYALHLKALGHDPAGPVPPEVQRHRDSDDHKKAYTFRGHSDDQFLVQPIQKSEYNAELSAAPTGEPNQGHYLIHVTPTQVQLRPPRGSRQIFDTKDQAIAFAQWHANRTKQPFKVRESTEPLWKSANEDKAPLYGPHRQVADAAWPHILASWVSLAKSNDAPSTVRQFDARKTWLRHRHTPEEKAFDYSPWLTSDQRKAGYRMILMSHGYGNPVRAHVLHSNAKVGSAAGNVDQGDLEIENYHVNSAQHQNKGLEESMLNAVMGHAKKHLGANYLSHGPFTPSASALIEAIAKPHGLELGEVEDTVAGESPVDRQPAIAAPGGVKMRSQQPNRTPRTFAPSKIHKWWAGPND